MRIFATPLRAICVLFPSFLAACGDGGPTSLDDLPQDLVVTWFATSLSVAGDELLDDGTRLQLTFTATGTYEFNATKDIRAFVCDDGVFDCIVSGEFDASTTEVIFDPGPDEARLSASLIDSVLRLTGSADGQSLDLTFVVPPYPALIGTWLANSLTSPGGQIGTEGGGRATTLAITFEADGRYFFASTFSPQGQFCDLEAHCLGEGSFAANSDLGEVVFEPDDVSPTTMAITVSPGLLELSGLVDTVQQEWILLQPDVATPGEQGSWWAIGLQFGGDQVSASDADHRLTFAGTTYNSEVNSDPITDPAVPHFFCSSDLGPPCAAVGSFVAQLDQLEFLNGLENGPETVSLETTPVTLRLFGTIDGTAADFLYARVPPRS